MIKHELSSQPGGLTFTLYEGEVRDAWMEIPANSVDVVFTSYPYKKKDGYTRSLMGGLGHLIAHVLRPGGRLFLNGGQLREDLVRPFEARRLVEEGASGLLVPGQTIAWVKSLATQWWRERALELLEDAFANNLQISKLEDLRRYLKGPGTRTQRGHYQSLNTEKLLNYCWEPIFTFYKPPELDLNRRAIGAPFTDKSNMKRGSRGQHGDLHCAGDVWVVPYETTGKKRKKATAELENSYSFPDELVERALKVAGLAPGCTVFDPFMGSGTTARVAKRLGFHSVGIECHKVAARAARDGWKAEVGSRDAGRV